MNGVVKRFHLHEFLTPFAPDLDRQEMPNSIILDFCDGRTLQCALPSPISQQQVLKSMYLVLLLNESVFANDVFFKSW
jgi:hypothetical protein